MLTPTHRSGPRRAAFRLLWPCALLLLGGCTLNRERGLGAALFPPKPGELARDAFNTYDADKRRTAVTQLANTRLGRDEVYVRLYRLLSDDPDATVRAAAARALGMHGGVDDVPWLTRRLEDVAPAVRWEAAKGLQKIHSPLAAAPLSEALARDEDADVRMAAAAALGQYPRRDVFNVLVGALDDTDFGVVDAARDSLATLTGYDFGADGALWLIWARRNAHRLFEHQQEYTWQPPPKPRGWLGKAGLRKPSDSEPRPPRGVAAQTDGEAGG